MAGVAVPPPAGQHRVRVGAGDVQADGVHVVDALGVRVRGGVEVGVGGGAGGPVDTRLVEGEPSHSTSPNNIYGRPSAKFFLETKLSASTPKA